MSKITSFGKLVEKATIEGMPPASSIISGTPSFKTWVHFEDHGMKSGEWEVMPGSWRVCYDRWEFMHILSGSGSLHSETGVIIALRPGISVVTEPGFQGHWTIHETLRKSFFVREK